MSITVKNLSKSYGSQAAVDNISFSVAKGEIVGFLGPNGAGKSTTMKMITGYLEPDAGTVAVSGVSVAGDKITTKQKIGYLPEANPLYFEMYVREYLNFTADVHGVKDSKKRIEEVIRTVGLTPEANKKIGQLSKGYKQRVGLAAAMIHEPDVLILDEPTSGLDPNQIIEIRNVIRSLAQNKTVLFSSHILQEAEAICDRVIIINKGKIVADDSISSLQSRNFAKSVVRVEFRETIDVARLEKMPAVSKAEAISTTSFRLFTDDAEQVRKQLLQLSIDNNWNVVSLQNENSSLEDVFRMLTTS